MLKLEHFLFYLTVFLLPIQIGKHFWPDFSKISGIRIDYLSPTIYLTDIVIFTLEFLFILRLMKLHWLTPMVPALPAGRSSPRDHSDQNPPNRKFPHFHPRAYALGFLRRRIKSGQIRNHFKFIIIVIIFALVNIYTSRNFFACLYGWVKFAEFAVFGYYVANFGTLSFKKLANQAIFGGLIASFLGIWQFVNQRSVGGLFYFLGERTFSLSTLGISTIHMDGTAILRSYSSFPHPNVFAYYLYFVSMLTLLLIFLTKKKILKIEYILVLLILFIALLLTFSRIVLFAYVVSLFIINFFFFRRILRFSLLLLIPLIIYFIVFESRYLRHEYFLEDFYERVEQYKIALNIFYDNLFLGVGLKNYFYHASELQKNYSSIFIQPVHNAFFLILIEVGLLGLFPIMILLQKTFKRLIYNLKTSKKSNKIFYSILLVNLIAIINVGLFDHFFITLQQGQMLLALSFGMSFAKNIPR